MDQQRYPLSWPAGWPRSTYRRTAPFSKRTAGDRRLLDISDGLDRLQGELRRLVATNVVISTNLRLNLDGSITRQQASPSDVGVAVYFKLKGQPRVLACDRWSRIADNMAAIAGHIEAIRTVERYGVGTMEQAFAGYAQLQSSPSEWWIVLQVTPDANSEAVDAAYRRLARAAHPDAGGSHDAMARINAARDAARAAGR